MTGVKSIADCYYCSY